EADYRTLYRDVIAAIRAARSSPDVLTSLIDRAKELAAPWVTLAALDNLDARTRVNLYRACREVDNELSPVADSGGSGGWLRPAAWAAAAAGVVAAGWTWPRWGADAAGFVQSNLVGVALAVPVVVMFLVVATRRRASA
ncbi:MAG TPA: hypothetical protein VD866_26370, partial [Urbifossiella sp.]|nr:hypothetical protein [Urbifossiella sp.]